MNQYTNKFRDSAAKHPATEQAAVPSGLVPTDGRGGQPSYSEKDLQGFLERNANHPTAPFHMPDEVVICLPMPPTTNNLFAGSGKHRFRTREYNAWINEAGYRLNVQRPPQVIGKVSLLIEVEEPGTAREMDLMNREKATTDLLVKHRIIEGDSNRYVRKFAMEWAPIEGVRVTICPIVNRPLASENGVAG